MNFDYYYWGPLLFKTKLDKKVTNRLLREGKKATLNAVPHLAGIIQNELYFDQKTYDWFQPVIANIGMSYIKFLTTKWLSRTIEADIHGIKLRKLWINFMKENESNPLHTHMHCHLSFVTFLKVPNLKKERADYTGKASGAGSLTFFYGTPEFFCNNGQTFEPIVGDLFIFPYNLQHAVIPYKTKGQRISVAGNLSFLDKSGNVSYL